MTSTRKAASSIGIESLPETFIVTTDREPIKILHIINDLSIGGAEMMLLRLLSHKSRARFDPVVVSLMDRGSLQARIEALGIAVYTAGMKPGMPTPASIWRLVRLTRKIKPDLIQGWLYHGSLAAQLAGLFVSRKIPVFWSIHCSISSFEFEKRLTKAVVRMCALASRFASNIVFVSQTSRAQHAELGYNIKRSCVVPNGIDTKLFAPSKEARASVREELGLGPDTPLIGTIGRYNAMKDHASFLGAAARISKSYPNAHFMLAGRGLDDRNRAIAELTRSLQVQDRVHLLGERSDIARLVAALDIFVLSSAFGESFPIIVGEAMACAIPCVVTEVGDSGWMVGNTGRVVSPRDEGALQRSCEELLNMDREERARLGAAARTRVADLFSLSSVVARYEELYEDAVSGQSEVGSQESGVRSQEWDDERENSESHKGQTRTNDQAARFVPDSLTPDS
jgi:glycosyltransferase involved in cell wall biosynthesis